MKYKKVLSHESIDKNQTIQCQHIDYINTTPPGYYGNPTPLCCHQIASHGVSFDGVNLVELCEHHYQKVMENQP